MPGSSGATISLLVTLGLGLGLLAPSHPRYKSVLAVPATVNPEQPAGC